MFRFLLSLSLFLFFISCVVAYNASSTDTSVKSIDDILELTDVDEGRRRRKNRFPFGFSSQIWWWGLKALSVFITVKIKIVLLILFLGGGIFYGLKVWNGSALGCPEPIIQEIKHHDIHDVLPYHGHHDFTSPDVYSGYSGYSSYPGHSSYSGYSGLESSGGYSGAYSNTPPPSTDLSHFGVPFSGGSSSSSVTAPDGTSDPSGSPSAYLPPNRRATFRGRAIDVDSAQMATDLVFRFLGVNTAECRKRFVCELEFRNPLVEYAMRYIGHDLFSEYRTAKEAKAAKFTECAILYPDCSYPKRNVNVRRRNEVNTKKTDVENEETQTEIPDSVTKYVKNSIKNE